MYSCDIQVRAEVLGRMYSVLGRRHGKVVCEDMIEGSSVFTITAHLPVIESFNFAQEVRKQTSGLAQPQLVFRYTFKLTKYMLDKAPRTSCIVQISTARCQRSR